MAIKEISTFRAVSYIWVWSVLWFRNFFATQGVGFLQSVSYKRDACILEMSDLFHNYSFLLHITIPI